MKKYLCVGTDKVPAEWLPRWYGVPFDECMFAPDEITKKTQPYTYKAMASLNLIHLIVIPNGCYKQHLKILKTERLLNGI